jgi:ammonium transporter, Amt family
VAHLRSKSTLDDTLDVFPCHGVGGMVGMIMTGIFAITGLGGGPNVEIKTVGLAFGETSLFVAHMIALVAVSAFAFGMSYLLLIVTNAILPMRVSEEDEKVGLDVSQHDEYLIEA